MPRRFKAPTLKAYDSTTNPFNHLENFKSLMLLQGASDDLICKSFPTTFRKMVRAWYTRLPSRSIHSSKEFGHQFTAQFQSSKRPEQDFDFLFSIQQGKSLHYYTSRFKAAMLEVRGLEPSISMLALKKGLHEGSFYFSLSKKFPRDLPKLLARAKKYINTKA